jgi:hypothetical protein
MSTILSSPALRLAAAALTTALLALPLSAQAPAGGAAGKVVDARSETPLAGALVEVEGTRYAARTDEAGRFSLRLPPGQYRAFIQHPLYKPASEGWWVSSETLSITVALEPNVVALDPVTGTADRDRASLEDRIPLGGGTGDEAPTVFGEAELGQSGSLSAADFVLSRLSLVKVPCQSPMGFVGVTDSIDECVRIRGSVRRVCVAMDEAALPGGLSVLSSYRPRDLARVSAFRGGEFVMIYTKSFVYNVKAHEWRPVPISAQMNAFCRMR